MTRASAKGTRACVPVFREQMSHLAIQITIPPPATSARMELAFLPHWLAARASRPCSPATRVLRVDLELPRVHTSLQRRMLSHTSIQGPALRALSISFRFVTLIWAVRALHGLP